MNQTERKRFLTLLVILVILVIAGIIINRARRQAPLEADILGVIQNQAVATFKDGDGQLQTTTLSDISQITVSSGVANLTVNYVLERKPTQSAILDVQFYRPNDDKPWAKEKNRKSEQGSLFMKLKNIPNGNYDISVKPEGFLSQVKLSVPYLNGKATTLDFKEPDVFLWGDIDVSNGGKGDNKVNNADAAILFKAWNQTEEKADINEDGVVNNVDFSVLIKNWNKTGRRFNVEPPEIVDSPPPEL